MAWISHRLLAALLPLFVPAAHAAEDTIKVGILHSLSGTMAVSESVLKDTVLMLIANQNKKGGLLGRKLEPVVVDPASNWDAFTDKAYQLLDKEKVAVVFGCWTSASRKAVIPVFERWGGLLFYPVQHEGEQSSRNVFYTGAAPSQQALPAVRYLMSKEGGQIRRWVAGTFDVVWRSINPIKASVWSRYIPESARLTADWTFPWVYGDAPSRPTRNGNRRHPPAPGFQGALPLDVTAGRTRRAAGLSPA